MATDEQAETLEQTVRLEAIGASMRFEGPDEESQEERWRLAVRPLVEIIADLRSAATRTNEAGNSEIEKLNREIYCLRADLTEARDSGQAYADKLTAAQTAGRDQASELEKARAAVGAFKADAERLKGALADAQDVIERADEQRRRMSADLVSAHGQHMRDKTDLAEARTTVDVLAGRLAARGQS